jgi:carboxymethylenebutenolidase
MGAWTRLTAADEFELSGWLARPAGHPLGAIVLVQEIFGVNLHIRNVAESLSEAGYLTLAPSLFDRAAAQVQLGYGPDGVERGVALMKQVSMEEALLDVNAARTFLGTQLPVAILGFCWGGLIAWLAACRVPGFAAAVPYYAGGIGNFANERPGCRVLLHFAEFDEHIPTSDARAVEVAHPDTTTVHVYPARHGFHCDERASHDPQSAALAWQRSLAFLRERFSHARIGPTT